LHHILYLLALDTASFSFFLNPTLPAGNDIDSNRVVNASEIRNPNVFHYYEFLNLVFQNAGYMRLAGDEAFVSSGVRYQNDVKNPPYQ
jgi:hypothetical protein